MTPDTLACCKRYVHLCERILDPAIDIQIRMDEAEQLVALHGYLNTEFARHFEYAEMRTHCTQIVAAWEQLAA